MRITDDRYTRDRLRIDLAMRLIGHEARTSTIRLWTGLTDDRIRRLYRHYVADGTAPAIVRHRGKSPAQLSFFTRSDAVRQDAAALGTLLQLYGALPARPVPDAARVLPCAWRGELLCSAYESFRRVNPDTRISFEHAAFLLVALARSDELQLAPCAGCGSPGLVDRLAMRPSWCSPCGAQLAPGLVARAAQAAPFATVRGHAIAGQRF
ncbi:MAG: hypothetical protein R3E65_10860 [Steroidobacteraceae bacterium]